MRRARRKLVNQINVVPFIDVMLVLLIVFMVAAPMIQTGEVALPTVGQSLAPTQKAVEVLLRKDLSLAVRDGGSAVAGSTLKLNRAQAISRLKAAQAQGERPVVIVADKSVPHGDVMALLSALHEAGLSKVGFMAEHGETPK